jgi:tRNA(Ile)-lysidine synthase
VATTQGRLDNGCQTDLKSVASQGVVGSNPTPSAITMINIQGDIPNKVAVAVSGGPDSMAVLDFLRKSKREVSAAFFHHYTQESRDGLKIIQEYCNRHSIRLRMSLFHGTQLSKSYENQWRTERYIFLHSLPFAHVITCHHLDDCVEEFVISTMKRGFRGVIPYLRVGGKGGAKIIRPFRLTLKEDLVRWCKRNDIQYISSVGDDLRTKLRKDILPLIREHVNPGITKMVRKMILGEEI